MKIKMRLSLALMFVLLQASGFGESSAQTLRQEADKAGMLIGAAVDPRRFAEPAYAATLAREFNMIEAENVMKWGGIRPDRKTFDFTPGDKVVAFARTHKMKVRGHTLLWSEYNPAWLTGGRFTPDQLRSMLRQHITTVMKHYAGRVFAWDVVNESFDANGEVEPSIWYDSPGIGLDGEGTAYIEQAFRWARAADPKALLFYNDYDVEGINAKSDAVYRMVKDFKRRGVPIDGVGLQAHIFDLSAKDLATFSLNIKRFVDLGVQIHITEMDVGLPVDADGNPTNQADVARQADIYRRVSTACLQQTGCTAVQTWGFTDKYTWIPAHTKNAKGAPLLFDHDYAPKPSYAALLDAFTTRARPRN